MNWTIRALRAVGASLATTVLLLGITDNVVAYLALMIAAGWLLVAVGWSDGWRGVFTAALATALFWIVGAVVEPQDRSLPQCKSVFEQVGECRTNHPPSAVWFPVALVLIVCGVAASGGKGIRRRANAS